MTDDDRFDAEALAQRTRARARAPAADNSRPASAREKPQQFSDLPAYKAMTLQQAVGDEFGIANPFFRPHDERAGARTQIDGKTCLNFASYDYLGLNGHPALADAANRAMQRYGTSVSASRIVAGERPLHRDLEKAIAGIYQTEDAVVFVSGHATNVAVIGELMQPGDLIVHDAIAHNSAIVGAQLSGATRRNFAHNDLDALEALLDRERSHYEKALIFVEGLYSMDGDVPDLKSLIALKRRYNAWLMVDEAHALGTLGENGLGIAEYQGIDPGDVDIWMGTMSKTLASCGGYIAGSAVLVDLLKYQAPGFVYSVGMAPPAAAAALQALELLHTAQDRISRLCANGKAFLGAAKNAGLDTGFGQGHAVAPVVVGDSLCAAKLSENLLDRGINVLPIIYPAVPMQQARLRFFISSEHDPADLKAAALETSKQLNLLTASGFGRTKPARS